MSGAEIYPAKYGKQKLYIFPGKFLSSGGFTNLIDYQTIPVLIDILRPFQDDILDLITDREAGFISDPW